MLERIDNPDGSYLLVTYLNEHEVVISEFNASGEMVREVWGFVPERMRAERRSR